MMRQNLKKFILLCLATSAMIFIILSLDLSKIQANDPVDLEESSIWQGNFFKLLEDNFDYKKSNLANFTKETADKKSGDYSLKITSTEKQAIFAASTNLNKNLQRDKKYKLSFWLKLKNRTCYNIENYKYLDPYKLPSSNQILVR